MGRGEPTKSHSTFWTLTVTALGVVFGDIGTSPLYAVREAFHGAHGFAVNLDNVLGVLSLIFWALILIISAKYLLFVMRANNRGEGGVLALTALAAPPRFCQKSAFYRNALLLGLFGSALLFGDGVITPAITVLSAVEGLSIATPFFDPYVIPITIGILTGLFLSQYHGTARIGAIFGPVILVWFLVIGALGIYGICLNPEVIYGLNPYHAVKFFILHGTAGFVVLTAVFLAVTGGEALYADMGHFGQKPIQAAWLFAALPGLVLNYFGQGALLLAQPDAVENPFYRLAPAWALLPLVGLAAMASVIASQALISGVFSLTRQATQLGYAPRFRIVHTSSEEMGQIYVPRINWALFAMTCWIVLEFESSSALAAAYGIAVSLTMVITTLLAASVARQRWRWGLIPVISIVLPLLAIDLIFLSANISKIADGGWFPLTIGAVIFTCMTTWRKGRQVLAQRLREKTIPLEKFISKCQDRELIRVKGCAVFMTGDPEGTPPALLHNSRHNKALHETIVLLTMATEDIPHIAKEERIDLEVLKEGFYRVTAYYGFMETPNIVDVIEACASKNVNLPIHQTTFFLGRETLIPTGKPGMAVWREFLFAFMSKNAERATAYFNIPADQVVELGIQIEL